MPEDIEVKLSPLDEESKQALLSFVGALKEVRNSMNDIKKQLVPDLAALTQAIQSAGGGGTAGSPGGIPGGGSNPNSQRGPNASVATSSGPGNVSYPSDIAGYGSVAGTGDENSPRRSSASSAASPGAPGFAKSASWYSDTLRIPRINEFNVQDYSQMAGKAVAGRAASRYQENYQQARAQGASSEDAHGAATYQAEAPGGLTQGFISDKRKMQFGQAAEKFGSIGPYVAATHGLSPTMLANGYGFAPGVTQRISAGMGVPQDAGLVSGFTSLGGAVTGSGSNVAARMFEQVMANGRGGFLDPNTAGAFSFADRSKFAEAAQQEGMGGVYNGGAFTKAFDSYSSAINQGKPIGGMDPAQYATMFQEQIRNGAATQDEAARNLEKLGDAALTSGQNIQQLGEAAQAYHAANPQFSNAVAVEQTAKYANAGVNGATANQILQNGTIQGQANLDYGILPNMLPGLSPDLVLESGKRVADRMMNQYANTPIIPGRTQKESTQAMVVTQLGQGATQETLNAMQRGDKLAAMERVQSGQDNNNPQQLREDLENAQRQNFNTGENQEFAGKPFGKFTQTQIARILGAEGGTKGRNKVITDVTAEGMGFVKGGEGMPKTADEYLKQLQEEANKANATPIEIEFTGVAKTWFQQHKNELPKDPAGSNKKGVTPPPNKSPRYVPKGY